MIPAVDKGGAGVDEKPASCGVQSPQHTHTRADKTKLFNAPASAIRSEALMNAKLYGVAE